MPAARSLLPLATASSPAMSAPSPNSPSNGSSSTLAPGSEDALYAPSQLTRMHPDSILADEADPDSLLGNESDEDRPKAPKSNAAAAARAKSSSEATGTDAASLASLPHDDGASSSSSRRSSAMFSAPAMSDEDEGDEEERRKRREERQKKQEEREKRKAAREAAKKPSGIATPTTPEMNGDGPSAASAAAPGTPVAAVPGTPATATPRQTSFTTAAVGATAVDSSASAESQLRAQIEDLTNQVTGLNGKLVASFERLSDLEDDHSELNSRILRYTTRIAELEKEREEHLAALNTGLLVEKAHVSNEMQRMMERLVEETAERGKAQSDKERIEAELDELSASLFNEANSMVAKERLDRARAEEKSRQMEERLQNTEHLMEAQQSILADLQRQLDEHKARGGEATIVSVNGASSRESAFGFGATSRGGSSSAASGAYYLVKPEQELYINIKPFEELRSFLDHLRKLRKQLAPFYNYPLDAPAPSAAPRRSIVGTDGISRKVSGGDNGSAAGSAGTEVHSTPFVFTGTLAFSQGLAGTGPSTTNPFVAAGQTRHRDYPSLPANAESLVHLPSQTSHPFIKRALEEDSDPTLRLDLAPGLNWLSRRQAHSAVLEGQLVIEPVFAGGVLPDTEDALRLKYADQPQAACALCGVPVVNVPLPGSAAAGGEGVVSTAAGWISAAGHAVPSLSSVTGGSNATQGSTSSGTASTAATDANSTTPSTPPPASRSRSGGLFSSLRSSISSATSSRNSSAANPAAGASASGGSSTQPGSPRADSGRSDGHFGIGKMGADGTIEVPRLDVPTHIFRLNESSTTRYLLCPHHCLGRLRAVCAFWGYVRSLQRAVVLEGKLAWDDAGEAEREYVKAPSRTATPRLPGGAATAGSKVVQGAVPRVPSRLGKASTESGASGETATADAEAPEPVKEDKELKTAIEKLEEEAEKAEEKEEEEKETAEAAAAEDEEKSTKMERRESKMSRAATDDSDGEGFADAQSGASSEADEAEEEKTVDDKPGADAAEDKAEGEAEGSVDEEEKASEEAPTTAEKETSDETAEQQPGLPSKKDDLPPPPLPSRRAVPAPPPALPPRRKDGATDGTADSRSPTSANAAAAAATGPTLKLLPAPKRVVPLHSGTEEVQDGSASQAQALMWEEKVWQEVLRLKTDMFRARAGFKTED